MGRILLFAALCVCCFSQALAELQRTTCDDGWLPFRGSCYLFGDDNMVFDIAEQFCRNHNSHLVHVNDAVENAFLRTWLHKLKVANWWMGLKDEYIEGVFQWTDTNDSVIFSDWYPGEPSTDGDCVHFYSGEDFHWNDVACMTTRYQSRPLCEKRETEGTESIVG